MSKKNEIFDVIIIGGGINGTGIARDLAGNGLSVLLLEKGDLAQATSSASSKLIHGGLRYLEYFEFGLVKKALQEREVLLNLAPHIIRPMDFILPHIPSMRPEWIIRLGLFLYDNLGGRKYLGKSRKINLPKEIKGEYKKGYIYQDCWVDDARLVILNAVDAKNNGAVIKVRSNCTNIIARENLWEVFVNDSKTNYKSRLLINAAGPWVRDIVDNNDLSNEKIPKVRLVKGSHIIVPAIYEREYSYIFQQDDGRVVFAIPYEKEFTMIGTTDIEFSGNVDDVSIDEDEINYLCSAVNKFFDKQIDKKMIVHSFSGVRPLFDDGKGDASSVTRDYHIECSDYKNLQIISIFGGKITTYRKLAEEVAEYVSKSLNKNIKKWTANASLTGGEVGYLKWGEYKKSIIDKYNYLPEDILERMLCQYGRKAEEIIKERGKLYKCGKIYEGEVRYLVKNEWARSLDDILWRRTKLGLVIKEDELEDIKKDLNVFLKKEIIDE